MDHRMERWKELAAVKLPKTLGHTAYAHCQAALWKSMGEYARSHFTSMRERLGADDTGDSAEDSNMDPTITDEADPFDI